MAILDRTRALPRKFRRITGDRLAALLRDDVEPDDPGPEVPPQIATGADRARDRGRREPVTRLPEPSQPVSLAKGRRRRRRRRRADRRVHRLRADRGRLPRCTCRTGRASHARVAAGLGAGTVEPAEPDRVDLVVVAVPPGRDRRRRGREPRDLPAGDRHRRRLGQGRRAGRPLAPGGRPDPLRRLAPDGRLAALRTGDRPGGPVHRPHLGGDPAPPLGRRTRWRGCRPRSGPAAPGRW